MKLAAIALLAILLVAGCLGSAGDVFDIISLIKQKVAGLKDLITGYEGFREAKGASIKATNTDVTWEFHGIRRVYTTTIDCLVDNPTDEAQMVPIVAGVKFPDDETSQAKTVSVPAKSDFWQRFEFADVNGNEGNPYCKLQAQAG